jgi:molybdenum cofactor cytidylyltransferase
MLGYLAAMPVVGVPGCARNPKANVIDLLLPRLLADERLSQRDLMALGYGGLL